MAPKDGINLLICINDHTVLECLLSITLINDYNQAADLATQASQPPLHTTIIHQLVDECPVLASEGTAPQGLPTALEE